MMLYIKYKSTGPFSFRYGWDRIFEYSKIGRIFEFNFSIRIFGCIFLIIVMFSLKNLKIKLKRQDLKLHRFGYKRSIMLLHPLSDSPAIVKYRVSLLA